MIQYFDDVETFRHSRKWFIYHELNDWTVFRGLSDQMFRRDFLSWYDAVEHIKRIEGRLSEKRKLRKF